MHIPTHQIHNVLNAYAKRLKKMHDSANGDILEAPEDQINAYSVEEKRRLIINKISADIVDKIIRAKPHSKKTKANITSDDQSSRQNHPKSDLQTKLIRYHILTKNGEKVSAKMKIPDSDFLIKQLEEIARKASES